MGIRTKVENIIVHTVTYNKLWVTIVSGSKPQDPIAIKSVDADNWYDAGQNHLRLCQQVKIALITNRVRASIPPVSIETEQTTQE